ncbi:hypothetical protein PG991_009407 [Apiospora marii]|uniref:Uncharacterized protein n=1 Tax=Apiospora marii TaxID=335849 RepID=A0ABR1RIQ6_9PEZI
MGKGRKPNANRPSRKGFFGKKNKARTHGGAILPQYRGYQNGPSHGEKPRGRLISAGCVSSGLKGLYLAELRVNQTHDVNLTVGYFGGCLSVANLTDPTGTTNTTATTKGGDPQTHCVTNLRTTDPEDLNEELTEDLHLPATVQAAVQDALNATVPYAVRLQRQAFFWPPPVLQTVAFAFSGTILFVAATAEPSRRAGYRVSVLVGAVLGAFGLGLALVEAVGFTQAFNGVLLSAGGGGSSSGPAEVPGLGKNSVYIQRGNLVAGLQTGLAVVAAFFYVFIGVMFVRNKH